jgi:hypothetical protein
LTDGDFVAPSLEFPADPVAAGAADNPVVVEVKFEDRKPFLKIFKNRGFSSARSIGNYWNINPSGCFDKLAVPRRYRKAFSHCEIQI